MKIKEIMTTNVISASPDSGIIEVADLIFQNRFHGLPITEKGKVVGIVTEDDFFLKDGDGLFLPSYMQFVKESKSSGRLPEEIKNKIEKLLGSKIKDIMTENCLTVSPETDASELMDTIKKTKFTTFPVVDASDNLLGIVTLSDILGTVKKESREMEKLLENEEKRSELYKSARQLRSLWQDNVVSLSKKSVRTWKGGIFIASFIALLSIFFWIVIEYTKPECGLINSDALPIICQKFNYTEWSQCGADGIQERQLISRLPEGCEGSTPMLVRKCR